MERKLFLIFFIFTILLASACRQNEKAFPKDRVAEIGMTAQSPSGKYFLKVLEAKDEGADCLRFAIYTDPNDNSVYSSPECYLSAHTTFFLWGKTDQVWVYSGDVGTSYWQQENGIWIKKSIGQDKSLPVPDYLKRARPEFFPNPAQ